MSEHLAPDVGSGGEAEVGVGRLNGHRGEGRGDARDRRGDDRGGRRHEREGEGSVGDENGSSHEG